MSRRVLVGLALALVALNAFDAWATLHFLGTWENVGEGNPLAARALEHGPAAFWALKLGMPAVGGAALVWRGGRVGLAALLGCVCFYAAIAAYHVVILGM